MTRYYKNGQVILALAAQKSRLRKILLYSPFPNPGDIQQCHFVIKNKREAKTHHGRKKSLLALT